MAPSQSGYLQPRRKGSLLGESSLTINEGFSPAQGFPHLHTFFFFFYLQLQCRIIYPLARLQLSSNSHQVRNLERQNEVAQSENDRNPDVIPNGYETVQEFRKTQVFLYPEKRRSSPLFARRFLIHNFHFFKNTHLLICRDSAF